MCIYKIKNVAELVSFQKKVLLKLINNKTFIKLENLFKKDQNITTFTKLFNFVFNTLNCKINKKKIKNNSCISLSFTFNLTTDDGIVIYDNPFIITSKNKIMNLYDINSKDLISNIFNNILEKKYFENSIQNKLVSDVNISKLSNTFMDDTENNVTYFSTFSNSTSGGSGEPTSNADKSNPPPRG
jgi:hypothetical protein